MILSKLALQTILQRHEGLMLYSELPRLQNPSRFDTKTTGNSGTSPSPCFRIYIKIELSRSKTGDQKKPSPGIQFQSEMRSAMQLNMWAIEDRGPKETYQWDTRETYTQLLAGCQSINQLFDRPTRFERSSYIATPRRKTPLFYPS